MNHKEHEEHKEKFTVSNESVLSPIRHCEEWRCNKSSANIVEQFSKRNERRSNLTSLINWREFFNGYKPSSLQTQSKEIAARIQQRQLSLLFNYHIQRLAMTGTGTVQEARFL